MDASYLTSEGYWVSSKPIHPLDAQPFQGSGIHDTTPHSQTHIQTTEAPNAFDVDPAWSAFSAVQPADTHVGWSSHSDLNIIPFHPTASTPSHPSPLAQESTILPSPPGMQEAPRYPEGHRPLPSSRQRTVQACDKCRDRKTKCSGTRPVCERCTARGLICHYSVSRDIRSRAPPRVRMRSISSAADMRPGTSQTGRRPSDAAVSVGRRPHSQDFGTFPRSSPPGSPMFLFPSLQNGEPYGRSWTSAAPAYMPYSSLPGTRKSSIQTGTPLPARTGNANVPYGAMFDQFIQFPVPSPHNQWDGSSSRPPSSNASSLSLGSSSSSSHGDVVSQQHMATAAPVIASRAGRTASASSDTSSSFRLSSSPGGADGMPPPQSVAQQRPKYAPDDFFALRLRDEPADMGAPRVDAEYLVPDVVGQPALAPGQGGQVQFMSQFFAGSTG